MNRALCFVAVAGFVSALAAAPKEAAAADPTTADCLGASNASLQSGNEHKLRAERSQLLVCAAPSCPADVRKECITRVDELNTQIPTIIFGAKDASGADLSAVKITMDAEVLADHLEGTALSVDPGEHTFTFETPGQPAVTKKYLIQQSQKDRREVIVFGASVTPAAAIAATPSPPVTTAASVGPSNQGAGLGTQKILALVAGGVGVVGLGLGIGFGISASSKKSDAQSVCPGACATQDGVDKWTSASSAGNVSTVGFIVAGVGLAGGAVLWFTAPKAGGDSSAQVGFGPGMLKLRGSF